MVYGLNSKEHRMKHRLAIFGLLVSGAAGAAFAALPSITVSDFELSGKYQCDATGGGNMWTFADSLSSVTNVTPDADGNPVGLLVNDPEGSVSGEGYARVVVQEVCSGSIYGCTSTAGFGIGFGKDLSRTYADPEDAANYGGRKVYDLTGLDSIDFWVKGTGPTGKNVSDTNGYWRIQLQSPLFNRHTNNYGYNIPKSRLKANTWVHIVIPVDSLTLWYGNDSPSKDLVLQYVTGLEFVGVGSDHGNLLDGELKVDNLKFVGLSAMKAQNGLIPIFISGDVNSNTTWGPGLYYVMGNINVYDTLTIEPGTHVVFRGNYRILQKTGALVAKGTAADSIIFTAADTSVGWRGLQFNGGKGDFRYVSLSYGKNAEGGCLSLGASSVSVANSRFSHCTATRVGGGAIYNYGQLFISGSVFDGNTSTSTRGSAIYNESGGTVSISSSLFTFNTGSSVSSWKGVMNILNSTFVGNTSSTPITGADTVVNSIVLGGEIESATYASHNFTANDGSIAFVDSANGDFRLSAASPAVNAGTSEKVALDSLDLAGNPRVAMGTVDIGAYERENTAPVKTADFAPVLLKEDAAPYTATLGGASADLHLSDYFSDADKTVGDSLRVASVSSSSTKFALLWNAAAGSLTVTPAPDRNGTDTILVTVADIDGATASAKMPIVIAPQNDAPKTVAPPILLITDQDTTFDFSGYFTDIDAGDALTYSAVLKKNVAGTLTAAKGITLTIPAAVSDTLKDTVTVTVTDDSAATASLAFPLWVVPLDHAPELDLAFHDTTANEDAPDRVLSLNDHFSDPDANTLMTYSAVSLQGKLSPSVSIAAGDTSLVLKFGADRNGTDSVVVTASDGFKSVRDTFTVAIRSINDAPTISDSIRGLVKDEDFADTVIDLSKHFSDVDGTLSYSAKASGKVAVTVKGSLLTLSSVANAFGTDSITVTATDDSAASVKEKLAISITPEDDAPVLTPIPDFAMQENTKDTLDLSQYYTEVDGQALTYSLVSVDNNTNGAVVNGSKTSIIPGTAKLTISLFSGATGTNAVTVSATDGTTAVPATFNVVASEVNDAPTRVATIPDISGNEGDQIKMDALTQYFSDDGGVTNLTFSTVSDNEKTVSVINGESSTPTLSLNAPGTARVIVTATDAAGLFAKDTLQVSVNGAPVIASTAPTNATEDEKYTYTVVASDAEGSALTYSLENAPKGMTIADTVISWTPENGVLTSGEVTLRVSDGETSSTQKFTVTVTPVNDAPVIASVKKDTTDENVPIRLTMSILTATDVDNKASELSLVIGTNAHYTVSGDTVKPAKNYTGTLSVPVRVTDGKDTSAVDTVEITVEGTTAIAGTGTRSSGLSILSSGGTVRINYSTAQTTDVTVGIYNLSGVKVLTLREGVQDAGMHEAVDDASSLNPGFYVGVLELNGAPVAKTKVLIRR